MDFSNILRGEGTPNEAREPSMEFRFIRRSTPPVAPETIVIPAPRLAPDEISTTPGGAVTGLARPPRPRADITAPLTSSEKFTGRVALETGGAFIGGAAGERVGGLTGLRLGEALGAGGGSLAAEAIDPNKRPFEEAYLTGAATFLTGVGASAGAGFLRRLVGKPSEAGEALTQILQREGRIPVPGMALESEFIQNAEAIGGAALGTSEMLKRARRDIHELTSESIRNYIDGFQRFKRSSELAFKDVDAALNNARVVLVGDDRVRDALKGIAQEGVRVRGSADALDTHMRKIYEWADGGPTPTFNFNETQKIFDSLYDKARALDLLAAREGTAGAKSDAKFIRELATEVKAAHDNAIDTAIRVRGLDPEIKTKLILARASWSHYLEGQQLQDMLIHATKDIVGDGPIVGRKLLSELDKLKILQKSSKARMLSPVTEENFRRYAIALNAVEQSGKSTAFAFIGRMGQLAALTGAGGLTNAPLFLAPHALAYTFATPETAAILMRGLKMEPGSAAAVRATRELLTILERERLIEPERIEESGPVRAGMEAESARRFVPQ